MVDAIAHPEDPSDDDTTTASTLLTPRQARDIMGTNTYGLLAAGELLGRDLSAEDKQALKSVPLSPEVLESYRSTHVLVACAGVSLMEVHEARSTLFYCKSVPWYSDHQFAREKIKAGWYLVRKDQVPGSTSKTWEEQLGLLTDVDEVPSACVLVQAILMHYLTTTERLFSDVWVRVTGVVSRDIRVGIGGFDPNGLHVNVHPDLVNYSDLGVSSSRTIS